MEKILVIEIPYAGLGDHLFHSHLPRIAKETGMYNKVLISSKSPFWHVDYLRIVWEINPFVDGFIDEHGNTCDLSNLVKKIDLKHKKDSITETNLLDEVMFSFGLDDGKRWHEPEIFYKPKYISKYNKKIYDPNYISYVGEINKDDVFFFFKRKKIFFDAVMKLRSNKALHCYSDSILYFDTTTLEDFCDLIFSCKEIHCFTTGTATLASAIGKPTYVYFGCEHQIGLRHSKLHTYRFINTCFKTKLIRFIKSPFKSVRDVFRDFSTHLTIML